MERFERSWTFRWRAGCVVARGILVRRGRRDASTTSVHIPASRRPGAAVNGWPAISTSCARRARFCECSISTRQAPQDGSGRGSFACAPPFSSRTADADSRGSIFIVRRCARRRGFGAATTPVISAAATRPLGVDHRVGSTAERLNHRRCGRVMSAVAEPRRSLFLSNMRCKARCACAARRYLTMRRTHRRVVVVAGRRTHLSITHWPRKHVSANTDGGPCRETASCS
jgi:hypothetical protein